MRRLLFLLLIPCIVAGKTQAVVHPEMGQVVKLQL